MRSEHIVEVSRSNFDSAIEAFLRATDVIHDSETPERLTYDVRKAAHEEPMVKITITFKQEVKSTVDQTVH